MALAKESFRRLKQLLEGTLDGTHHRPADDDKYHVLFRTTVDVYNAVLKLDAKCLPRYYQAVNYVPAEVLCFSIHQDLP